MVEWFAYEGDVIQLARGLATRLLEADIVEGVVSGISANGKLVPHVIRRGEGADGSPLDCVLLYGYRGLESTVRFVRERKGERLAVFVKPCEARALVELAKRKQVNLSGVFVIGFDCPGVSVGSNLGGGLRSAMGTVPKKETLRDACKRCDVHEPPYADVCISLLASPEVALVRVKTEKGRRLVEQLAKEGALSERVPQEFLLEREEKLNLLNEYGRKTLKEEEERLLSTPSSERFSWFMEQLDSCVKCSACIRACPICFCKDCILITKRKEYPSSLFIVTKMLHMADACVCCGKCDEVCPKSIPLSYMFYHLGRKFNSRYGYIAGVDFSKPPRII